MKLSLSWIFDHLTISWKTIDVTMLFDQFNRKVAEIDSFEHYAVDLSVFTLGRVVSIKDYVTVTCAELQHDISLPHRTDAHLGKVFVLIKKNNAWAWAGNVDLQSETSGLFPAITVSDVDFAGGWKEWFEAEDYIITLDNKSITHRPDLWGHRGFAREIGALLSIPLKEEKQLLASCSITSYDAISNPHASNPFTLAIENKQLCRRLAGFYVKDVTVNDSLLWMAHRLLRVDSRPIDSIVDSTNYGMFDWGQPIHAFDADAITSKKIVATVSKAGQLLTLLDDEQVNLTGNEIVISDGKNPLALAGIMGGKESAVQSNTRSLLIESANFNAGVIRKTSTELKKRTEASSRFEKSLDPNQNVKALQRCIHLLRDSGIMIDSPVIDSVGQEVASPVIEMSHEFIEKKLGLILDPQFIISILTALEFKVEYTDLPVSGYKITVPTFRATKDIQLPEDIVEEVGRFYGYDRIPVLLPQFACKSYPIAPFLCARSILDFLVFAGNAGEVKNYAVFDEEFIQRMHYKPELALEIKNPISENQRFLVTSLIPHLFKNVYTNCAEHHQLNFVECNRVWHQTTDAHNPVSEQRLISGIFYDAKKVIDFYEKKQLLNALFDSLRISIEWIQPTNDQGPWYHPYQTAILMRGQEKVGVAGLAHPGFMNRFLSGHAFIFELRLDTLLRPDEQAAFKPLSKYPDTWFDISMMVPLSLTVDQLKKTIAQAHENIFDVSLIDFFEKKEWIDKKSVTFRFFARDVSKTLTQQDIDYIYDHVKNAVQKLGAIIR